MRCSAQRQVEDYSHIEQLGHGGRVWEDGWVRPCLLGLLLAEGRSQLQKTVYMTS
eukprot:COSAG01_NODE_2963_length_6794_cov_3.981321_6_plen_55_part_00